MCLKDVKKRNLNTIRGSLKDPVNSFFKKYAFVEVVGEITEKGSAVKAKISFSDKEEEIQGKKGFSVNFETGKVTRHNFPAADFFIIPWVNEWEACLSQISLEQVSDGVLYEAFQGCLESLKDRLRNILKKCCRAGILVKKNKLVSFWILNEGKIYIIKEETEKEEEDG
ncbi:MAG: hypothetical protein A2430_01120 [Candidatus Liptonbacteria bacterium RIFOXYC1_FULL_36_8]|uniref:Uncharacterized protein n=1 Tax=Candidatus Liptonbacteria bacterium RIFOXYC1_FULL_36_8 TaxID=1798655 RepID=A0A1G2CQ76_9BACT|nr:MAG: hypothetical protein A2430_01120 [Candidatus Liptonbacteria bacterium RIFOXYC1_FULL_36_8]